MSAVTSVVPAAAAAATKKSPHAATKTKKALAAVATAKSHPTYGAMIKVAVQSMGGRGKGCSKIAVLKYIMANYDLGDDYKKVNRYVNVAIKSALEQGLLIQQKGTGVTGSFKLPPSKPAGKRLPSASKKEDAHVTAPRMRVASRSEPKTTKKATSSTKKTTAATKKTSRAKTTTATAKPKKPTTAKAAAVTTKKTKASPAKQPKAVVKKAPAKTAKPAAKKSTKA